MKTTTMAMAFAKAARKVDPIKQAAVIRLQAEYFALAASVRC